MAPRQSFHWCVVRRALNNLGPLTCGNAGHSGSGAGAIAQCPLRIITQFALERLGNVTTRRL
jgi:hypothetical protein